MTQRIEKNSIQDEAKFNVAKAKKIALENAKRKRRVLELRGRAKLAGQSTKFQRAEIEKLERKIRNTNKEIHRLGVDLVRVDEWAEKELLKSKAPSGMAPERYRGSGSGSYALGSSVKWWG